MAKRAGRPTKYFTHILPYIDKIKMWKRDGYTEKAIAESLGVSYTSAWLNYKKKYDEFKEALKEETEFTLAKAEHSLFDLAFGHTEKNFKEVWIMNPRTQELELKRREVLPDKIVAPHFPALKLVLYNCAPGKWVQADNDKDNPDEDYTTNQSTLLELMKEHLEDE